jgi:hypothetical protein
MLLCATDRQIRMIEGFAGCFADYHAADLGRWQISTNPGRILCKPSVLPRPRWTITRDAAFSPRVSSDVEALFDDWQRM